MIVTNCPECGRELPGAVTQGLCASCLFSEVLAPEPLDTGSVDTIGVDDGTEVDEDEFAVHSTGRFGNYDLIHEVARGGMGVVYKAHQEKLDRVVALKMIRSGRFASSAEVRRFQAEAASAAKLDHPNIVPIYEVGEVEGQHYFSMAFVDGQSLAERIVSGPMAVDESATIVKQIAEATAYAHSQNVIHRDLKPANVMLDKNGKVRVTDYGLAKQAEDESKTLTATGQVLGTPSFMPPEQASGKHGAVSRVSDVYSMGAILYTLCTGRPPFHAATPYDTITQVIEQEVLSPRSLNASIPRDLETICLKCLEKDPKRRYQSAAELADELGRFLNQETIQAKPATQLDRIMKWCKRHPSLAWMSAATILMTLALVVVSVAGFAIVTIENGKANKEKEIAEAARQEAERDRNRAEHLTYNMTVSTVTSRSRTSPGAAKAYLNDEAKCPRELREFSWHYLSQSIANSQYLFDGGSPIRCVTTLPSGQEVVTGHEDGSVRTWNLTTATMNAETDHRGACLCMAVSSRGYFATAGEDGNVFIYGANEAHDGVEWLLNDGDQGPVRHMTFTPDGTRVLWTQERAPEQPPMLIEVVLLNDGTPDESAVRPPHILHEASGPIRDLCVSPYSNSLFTVSDGNEVFEWDLYTFKLKRKLKGHSNPVTCLSVGINSELPTLAAGSQDGSIIVWNLATGLIANRFYGHNGEVLDLGFTLDDGTSEQEGFVEDLVSCGADGKIMYWSTLTDQRLATIDGHETVRCLAFTADNSTLITGGRDGAAMVWDTEDLILEQSTGLEPNEPLVGTLSETVDLIDFTNDGTDFVYANGDRLSSRSYQRGVKPTRSNGTLKTGKLTRYYRENSYVVFCAGGRTNLYDWNGRKPVIGGLKTLEGSRFRSEYSVDHNQLAYMHPDGTVHLYDIASQTDKQIGGNPGCRVCCFHPAIRDSVVIGDERGNVVWYQHGDHQALDQHAGRVTDLAIAATRDGYSLVSSSTDNSGQLWQLNITDEGGLSAVRRNQLLGHTDDINAVSFSPDGRTLATGSSDGTVRLWDPVQGHERTQVRANDLARNQPIHDLAFAPDGKTLAVGNSVNSSDSESKGRIWFWELED